MTTDLPSLCFHTDAVLSFLGLVLLSPLPTNHPGTKEADSLVFHLGLNLLIFVSFEQNPSLSTYLLYIAIESLRLLSYCTSLVFFSLTHHFYWSVTAFLLSLQLNKLYTALPPFSSQLRWCLSSGSNRVPKEDLVRVECLKTTYPYPWLLKISELDVSVLQYYSTAVLSVYELLGLSAKDPRIFCFLKNVLTLSILS